MFNIFSCYKWLRNRTRQKQRLASHSPVNCAHGSMPLSVAAKCSVLAFRTLLRLNDQKSDWSLRTRRHFFFTKDSLWQRVARETGNQRLAASNCGRSTDEAQSSVCPPRKHRVALWCPVVCLRSKGQILAQQRGQYVSGLHILVCTY